MNTAQLTVGVTSMGDPLRRTCAIVFLSLLVMLMCAHTNRAQRSTQFLGGSPIDPNGWNVAANWQSLIIPAPEDNVAISAGAFARFNIGTRTFNQVNLGSGSRIDVVSPSTIALTDGFSTSTGTMNVFGTIIAENSSRLFINAGGRVFIGSGDASSPATVSVFPDSITFLDGTLEVTSTGRFFMNTSSNSNTVEIGSTGRLVLNEGTLNASTGAQINVADGGEIFSSGRVSQNLEINLDGATSKLTFENSDNFSINGTTKRVTVNSNSGALVTYAGKGTMFSADMQGSNIRATVGFETSVVQVDSTSSVSLTLEDLSKHTYSPLGQDGTYSNSLGGPLTVNGSAAISFNSDINGQNFIFTSVQLALNNSLNVATGSTLRLMREGADIPFLPTPLDVSFTSLNPWTVGTGGTVVAGDLTRLSGVGLSYLSNANLTTRLEGNAVLDLVNSFGERRINRLESTSTASRVVAGTNSIILGGGDFVGQLETSGGLQVAGPLTLRSSQSYTGGTVIDNGASLTVTGAGRLGSGTATVNGTLDVTAATAGSLLLENLSGSGRVNFGTKAVTFSNWDAAAKTVGVTFDGSGTLTKEGTGTTRFVGTIVGPGSVRVNRGNLVVDSAFTQSVEVATGATLGGSGTTGAVNLAPGGFISPGNSPGTLNTGSNTWAGGANYIWEVKDAAGSQGGNAGWDWLNITGSLTINATSSDQFAIRISSLTPADIAGAAAGFLPDSEYSFALVTASGGIFGFSPDHFMLDATQFSDGLEGQGTFWLTQSGNSLVLNYQTIPEPSVVFMLTLALGIFFLIKLRRSHLHRTRATSTSICRE